MRMQIPEPVERIIEKLNAHGFDAFVVGGCVRDMLLGREPGDWDITTSARPEQVKRIFGHTIDTGILHGTVSVIIDRIGYEVTTYRIDGEYEDGRHPKTVEFTSDLLEDLRRRDFTMNAMAYHHSAGLVDAFGGREDLEQGIVRCVGNPEERFREDALRILRAIRFSAQLGFEIDGETKGAACKIAPNLARVSKERIQVELTKTLLSSNPDRIVLIKEMGLSPYISSEFEAIDIRMAMVPASLPPLKYLRWSALLRWSGELGTVAVLRSLKMDNDTIRRARTVVKLWRQEIPIERAGIRKVMSGLEPELYDQLLEFQKVFCRENGMQEEYLDRIAQESRGIREAGNCISLKMLAVTGVDLIEAGMKPGPEIGAVLNQLLELVLEHPEANTREYLLEQAKKSI